MLLWGAHDDDRGGVSVASVGDTDGDGREDLLVGTHRRSGGEHGWAYLHTGILDAGPALLLNEAGAVLRGSDEDHAGSWVAAGGDVDGDGLSDVILSAPGRPPSGALWLARGPLQGSHRLAEFARPLAGEGLSAAAAAAGDVDGDGWLDLIGGAPDTDWGAGAARLCWGPL